MSKIIHFDFVAEMGSLAGLRFSSFGILNFNIPSLSASSSSVLFFFFKGFSEPLSFVKLVIAF